MKKLLIVLFFTLFSASSLCQVNRFDVPVWTISTRAPQPGLLYPMMSFPNATVQLCATWNSSGCLTNLTTYTDISGSTPCTFPNQLVPSQGGSCSSTADPQGGIGGFALPGNYAFVVTTSYGIFGPYRFGVGLTALNATIIGAVGTLTNNTTGSAATATHASNIPADLASQSSSAPNSANFTQATVGGCGSVASALFSANTNGILNPLCFSGSDIGAQINAAYASCVSTGCKIQVPSGSYSFSTPVVIATKGVQAIIQCSGSATTLTYTPTSGVAFQFASSGAGVSTGWSQGIKDCHLAGPTSGTAVGIQLGVGTSDVTGRTAQGTLIDAIQMDGFNIQLDLESQAWNIAVRASKFQNPVTSQVYYNPAAVNSGEKISFLHDTFNTSNGVFLTNALNLGLLSGYTTFVDDNFDNVQLVNNGGEISCPSLYFEDPDVSRGSNPFILLNTGFTECAFIKTVNQKAGDTSPVIVNKGTLTLYSGENVSGGGATPTFIQNTVHGHSFISGDIFAVGSMVDNSTTDQKSVDMTLQSGINLHRTAFSWDDSTGGTLVPHFTNSGTLRWQASNGAEVDSWGPDNSTVGTLSLAGISANGSTSITYEQCNGSFCTFGVPINYGSLNGCATWSSGTLGTTGVACGTGSGGIGYPPAGIPNSSGTAWLSSYGTTGSGTNVVLATSPTIQNTLQILNGSSLPQTQFQYTGTTVGDDWVFTAPNVNGGMSLDIGKGIGLDSAVQITYNSNAAGAPLAYFGVYGETGLCSFHTGDLTVGLCNDLAMPFAVDLSGTASVNASFVRKASLSTGNEVDSLIGTGSSVNNASVMGFHNAGGTGSSSNYSVYSIAGKAGISVFGTGDVSINSTSDCANALCVTGNQINTGNINLGSTLNLAKGGTGALVISPPGGSTVDLSVDNSANTAATLITFDNGHTCVGSCTSSDPGDALVSTGKIRAAEGATTSAGFAFTETGNDSGMFSPSDGIVDLYANGGIIERLVGSGASVNGYVQINPTGTNGNEGLRIARSSNSYSTINLGTDSSGAGSATGQWTEYTSNNAGLAILIQNGLVFQVSGGTFAGQGGGFTNGYAAGPVFGVTNLVSAAGTTACFNTTGSSPITNMLGACTSLRKYKHNIEPLRSALSEIAKLKPISFDSKLDKYSDGTEKREIGFIAEEVEKIDKRIVVYDHDDKLIGVQYAQITALLIKGMQEQQEEIEILKKEIKDLKSGKSENKK